MAFAGVILLSADIASYSGERLVREATMDVVATIVGTLFMVFWINHALSRPVARLDLGMRQVAKGDYQVRLPVTSDDEMGHAAGRFNEMVEGLSEREYLRDTFGKYVSKSVATAILDNRDRAGRVADTTAEATLMFTDIEGFTGLSERLAPAEVAAILNAYLGAVVPVIQRHGGVVNSFIGDGLFASFNLPLPCENHAAAAIAAAIEIQRVLDEGPFAGHAALRTRIGINTGTVIGVTIGTDNRLNYTLLGDAVNVASRVEQLNKQFRTAHPRHREHGARRRRGPTASGWARPTCAATRTTSWSIASGRRHERAATPTEIAAIRRRYLLMATSALRGRYRLHPGLHRADRRLELRAALARRRRRPAGRRELPARAAGCSRRSSATSRARRASRTSQRRLTQLPLLTAQRVGDPGPAC